FGPVSRLLHKAIVPLPVPDHTTRVDWLAGASVLMRMDVLDRIGLFDETFFLYYEETELFHRAAQAGYATDYVRGSEVEHIGSASTGMKTWDRIPRFWLDSRLYYFTRVHGAGYAALATLARLTGGALWRLRCFLQRRDPVDPPHFLADMALHYATHAARARRQRQRRDWWTEACDRGPNGPLRVRTGSVPYRSTRSLRWKRHSPRQALAQGRSMNRSGRHRYGPRTG
ncbi:MAG: glycosyltransferase family 2 protein, partial [Zoogloea sp.]|nr:glycosyltransferase family 2 protein [Zoogloea sp.]